MKVRVFTLRLDPTTGTFDDAELAAFCDTHRVLSLTESFFTFDGTPTLALVVRYQPTATRAVPGGEPPATLRVLATLSRSARGPP